MRQTRCVIVFTTLAAFVLGISSGAKLTVALVMIVFMERM